MKKNVLLAAVALACFAASASAATPKYELRMAVPGMKPLSTGTAPPTLPVEPTTPAEPDFPGPRLEVSPSHLTFAPVLVGTTAPSQRVVFRNTGKTELNIWEAPYFSSSFYDIRMGDSSLRCRDGNTIEPGAYCEMWVTYMPSVSGPLSDEAYMDSDGGMRTVTVTGAGLAQPVLTLTQAPPEPYATVPKGTTTGLGTYTYVFKNNSTSALTASSTRVFPAEYANISANSCATTVAPGGSCSFTVTPTYASGGNIDIQYAESQGTTTVPWGFRVEDARLSSTIKGISGNTMTVELLNPNTVAHTVFTGINATSGPSNTNQNSAFQLGGCAGVNLGPKQTCTLTITYLPATGFKDSAAIMLQYKLPSDSVLTSTFLYNGRWW